MSLYRSHKKHAYLVRACAYYQLLYVERQACRKVWRSQILAKLVYIIRVFSPLLNTWQMLARFQQHIFILNDRLNILKNDLAKADKRNLDHFIYWDSTFLLLLFLVNLGIPTIKWIVYIYNNPKHGNWFLFWFSKKPLNFYVTVVSIFDLIQPWSNQLIWTCYNQEWCCSFKTFKIRNFFE